MIPAYQTIAFHSDLAVDLCLLCNGDQSWFTGWRYNCLSTHIL